MSNHYWDCFFRMSCLLLCFSNYFPCSCLLTERTILTVFTNTWIIVIHTLNGHVFQVTVSYVYCMCLFLSTIDIILCFAISVNYRLQWFCNQDDIPTSYFGKYCHIVWAYLKVLHIYFMHNLASSLTECQLIVYGKLI